ncbi:hypothetical protein DYB28_000751 [Aphanomyces astaci]|uniref:Uncharacterized protein n=1 Tax=Aphanomyces astaci TaxID=112090 RepID=A0A397AWJ4_APHAT|nr:hypothetical protein DYB36_001600 [Aphanomyces astaci]RLO06009.1 hypothetical protein DYB28_000751 [Aphanomyces astaci]
MVRVFVRTPVPDTPASFLATYHRLSVLVNVGFALNLATTPLMAYVAEPYPWGIPLQNTFADVPYDALDAAAAPMFQGLYNNMTMAPLEWFKLDLATLSYAVRYTLVIPPADEFVSHPLRQVNALVSFPGALVANTPTCDVRLMDVAAAGFYGVGGRALVYDFLAANSSARASNRWCTCQFAVLLGIPIAVGCLWFYSTSSSADTLPSTSITAFFSVQLFETFSMCWFKLAYRVALSLYVVWLLWSRYYRHIVALHRSLNRLGLDCTSSCTRYKIMLGDPSGLIMSEFVVAVVVLLDIWMNVSYLSIAFIQVSQVTDVWQLVWGGALFVCILTVFTKRYKWEAIFTPVDPTVLTIASYIYGGPVLAVFVATPAMVVVYMLRHISLPGKNPVVDMEVSALTHRTYSDTWWQVHKTTGDIKHRLLRTLYKQRSKDCRGGSIYKLFDRNPRYRMKPLTSLLSADVFVLCARGGEGPQVYDIQVRLSLVSLLDTHANDPALAITTCPREHRASVATLGHPTSCTTRSPPFVAHAFTCVHLGETDWLM